MKHESEVLLKKDMASIQKKNKKQKYKLIGRNKEADQVGHPAEHWAETLSLDPQRCSSEGTKELKTVRNADWGWFRGQIRNSIYHPSKLDPTPVLDLDREIPKPKQHTHSRGTAGPPVDSATMVVGPAAPQELADWLLGLCNHGFYH